MTGGRGDTNNMKGGGGGIDVAGDVGDAVGDIGDIGDATGVFYAHCCCSTSTGKPCSVLTHLAQAFEWLRATMLLAKPCAVLAFV